MNSILNKTLAIKIRQDLGVDHYTYGAPEEKAWDSACESIEKINMGMVIGTINSDQINECTIINYNDNGRMINLSDLGDE